MSAISFHLFLPCSLLLALLISFWRPIYPTSGSLNLLFLLTWIYSVYLFSCLRFLIQGLAKCHLVSPLLSTLLRQPLFTRIIPSITFLPPDEIILLIYVLTYLYSLSAPEHFSSSLLYSPVLTRDSINIHWKHKQPKETMYFVGESLHLPPSAFIWVILHLLSFLTRHSK